MKVEKTRDDFDTLCQYFGSEILLFGYGFTRAEYEIIGNESLVRVTAEKMTTHNFPDILPSEDIRVFIYNIIDIASGNQRRTRELLSLPGTIYYTADGREIKF